MKLSAKTEYACIAMLELAAKFDAEEPVRIRAIAEDHAIPQRFLVQILLQLKAASLVCSTRGASGGYRLSRSPEEISLADIVDVIEGPPDPTPTTNASPHSAAAQCLMKTWKEIADVERAMLAETTLADMMEAMRHEPEAMYYI